MLVRKTSNLSHLEGIEGEVEYGDLARPETFAAAMAGCDAVVHVAADYRLWIPDPDAMYRANVDGTRELLHAARKAGALGAKLSGGGRGGNMIALVKPEIAKAVSKSLKDGGAKTAIITTIHP